MLWVFKEKGCFRGAGSVLERLRKVSNNYINITIYLWNLKCSVREFQPVCCLQHSCFQKILKITARLVINPVLSQGWKRSRFWSTHTKNCIHGGCLRLASQIIVTAPRFTDIFHGCHRKAKTANTPTDSNTYVYWLYVHILYIYIIYIYISLSRAHACITWVSGLALSLRIRKGVEWYCTWKRKKSTWQQTRLSTSNGIYNNMEPQFLKKTKKLLLRE